MRVFDLHCDTVTECLKKGEPLRTHTGHVSLERGGAFEAWAQVFAVYVPDSLDGRQAAEYCDLAVGYYHAQLPDIRRGCRPILAVENGKALGGSVDRLETLAAKGVEITTLTWNGENELGYGAGCDHREGLKLLGKRVVRRMFELGMLPDVSHLNHEGFWNVAAMSDWAGRPLLATHSNCGAVQEHPRSLSDSQLREVFKSGGLVGLCLHKKFLGGEGTAEDFARHLSHVAALGGEKCVALGSDYDGCKVHPSLAGIETLAFLDEELDRLGFARQLREDLFWGNAARFFAA